MAAIPGGQYNPNLEVFRTNLETKVGRQYWRRGKLGRFTAFFDYEKFKSTGHPYESKGSRTAQESIVHVVRDFKSNKRGIKIDIPRTRPLVGQGRIGTAPLENHAEQKMLFYLKCAINMRRHALQVRDNEMSEQMLQLETAMELMEKDGSDLKDWFGRLMPFEFYHSVLTGYSENLFDSSWGLGYSQKSHPNTYVAGATAQPDFKTTAGAHTALTFDAGWEVQVAVALAELVDGVAKHKMSAQALRNMVFLAGEHNIQPITFEGQDVFPIFIDHSQARQLREDEDWLRAQHDAAKRGKDNQIFTGSIEGYLYEGALVVVDNTIPAARLNTLDADYDVTLSTTGVNTSPQYVRSNYMANPRDIAPRKPALLLGQGSIVAAEGKQFKLTQEEKDHGQKIEIGGRTIYGVTRADGIDEDNYLGNGAGKFYDNDSSLVMWTYSPTTIII